MPVHATVATAAASGLVDDAIGSLAPIAAEGSFKVGDLEVRCFSVPHDAVDNVGFLIEGDGTRLGYVTDLGHVTGLVVESLRADGGCDILMTEANHDERMLAEGPYPWSVKQRILGRHGHLSNAGARDLIAGVVNGRTRHLLLAHLSGHNNTPGLALEAGRLALEQAGRSEVRVHVTSQEEVSEVVEP